MTDTRIGAIPTKPLHVAGTAGCLVNRLPGPVGRHIARSYPSVRLPWSLSRS